MAVVAARSPHVILVVIFGNSFLLRLIFNVGLLLFFMDYRYSKKLRLMPKRSVDFTQKLCSCTIKMVNSLSGANETKNLIAGAAAESAVMAVVEAHAPRKRPAPGK